MATTRVFSGRAARGLGRTRRVALLVAFFAMALLMWGLLFANAASPAWASTITVNNLADTTANDGECTLREAITSANTNTASGAALGECTAGSVTGSDVIDIGVTGTVNLTNVLPDLSSNLQIEGPGADQLTVRRDTGSDYRIFSVASGSVVSISGITITNGNVTTNNGGGILNFGTLTISDSTISANSARFGGGIANGQGILTITDSTISGNTAMFRGGGVRNADGLSVIEHSTITKNTAPSEGSGISSFGNTNTSTEVLSTIVSANTNTDVDLAPDIGTNSFDSNGYNLIGDGNATAAFNQTGDQIGVSDPKLGDLTNNGGPTNTHTLLARSPAIDKGNTDLATDQRGAPRPFDDPSIAPAQGGDDSDIGSFEAQSVLNSATVATDDAYSTSEDTARTVDAPGILDNDTDPDTGDTLEAVLVSGPSHAASFILNADGSFTYEPDDNFNGPDSFTYQANDGTDDSNTATVSITVKAVNDAPLATDDTRTINEDGAPITIDLASLVSDEETSNANLTYNIVSGPTPAQGTLSGTGSTRTFDSADNFNGSVEIIYTVSDRGDPDDCGTPDDECDAPETSEQGKVTVTVSPVNDAPEIMVVAGSSTQSACLSTNSGRVTLKLSDVDTNVSALTLSRSSSNPGLVPNANVVFGGNGETRTATITTVSGRTGSSIVTLKVSDSQASASAPVTVRAGGHDEDTLTGTGGADLLLGRDDGDALRGFGGSDVLCGAKGADRLSGGGGADSFDGGSGTDTATDFNSAQGDARTNIP